MGRILLALLFALPASDARPASRGAVDDGSIEGAVRLPVRGPHHYVLPRRHRRRGLRWATRPLVDLLLEAAAKVGQRFPGSRLGVGNLSRRRGGPIPFSRSHQSGRDADLAFYIRDRHGRPYAPRDFVRFDRRGRGRRGLRFGVEWTWALVEALLTSPRARVQWLLIHRDLRALLLRHARKVGADPRILAYAEKVLHQPAWALPHDDHLHVRIYCSPEDVARGCRDTGPVGSRAQ